LQRFSVDQLRSPTFCSTEEFLDGCCKIQEAKHQAITLEDVKEILTAINKKHCEDNGIWAFGTSATPSRRRIARCFSFAADEMNVKLTNGVVRKDERSPWASSSCKPHPVSLLANLTKKQRHSKLQLMELGCWQNLSMCPVQPGMTTSANNAAVFPCGGVADQSSGKQRKLLDADESHLLRSAHVVDKDEAQNRFF
jgi:hypothetical protein